MGRVNLTVTSVKLVQGERKMLCPFQVVSLNRKDVKPRVELPPEVGEGWPAGKVTASSQPSC